MFRARSIGAEIVPTSRNANLQVNKRVIGVPGDTIVGKNGRVYVNGRSADTIPTEPFPQIRLGHDQYFVLGDNRSVSTDSRSFPGSHWPALRAPRRRDHQPAQPASSNRSSRSSGSSMRSR